MIGCQCEDGPTLCIFLLNFKYIHDEEENLFKVSWLLLLCDADCSITLLKVN